MAEEETVQEKIDDLDTMDGATLASQKVLLDEQAIFDVNVDINVVLGNSTLRVHQLLKLGRGAVVELEQRLDSPVLIYANDTLVAEGEVIVGEDDKIGVRFQRLMPSLHFEEVLKNNKNKLEKQMRKNNEEDFL